MANGKRQLGSPSPTEKTITVLLPNGRQIRIPADSTSEQISDMVRQATTRPLVPRQQAPKRSLLRRGLDFAAEVGPEAVGAGLGFGISGGNPLGALVGGLGGEAFQQVSGAIFPSTQPPSGQPATSQEAAMRLANAGTGGLLQEAGPGLRTLGLGKSAATVEAGRRLGADTVTQRIAKEAEAIDVPMTPAQRTQSSVLSAIESITRRGIVAAQIMQTFFKRQNQRLLEAADNVLNQLSAGRLSKREAGELLQNTIEDSRKASMEAIGAVRSGIAKQAGDIPIDRRAVRSVAQKMLDEFDSVAEASPALAKAEGLSTARNILSDFAVAEEPITIQSALQSRKLLNRLTDVQELNIAKGELAALNKGLDEAITKALETAGKGALAKQLKSSNAAFAEAMQQLDTKLIQKLIRADNPEALGKVLIGGGETSVKNLSRLIETTGNKSTLAEVQKFALAEIIDDAVKRNVENVSEGVLVGDALLARLDRLGDDFLNSLFKNRPDVLDNFRRVARVANEASLQSGLTRPISRQESSLLAFGQGSAAVALIAGDFSFTGGLLVLGPIGLAKLLTSKTGSEVLTLLARAKPGSTQSAKLIARTVGILQRSAETEAKQSEKRRLQPTDKGRFDSTGRAF